MDRLRHYRRHWWSRTWCGLVGVSAAPHPHPAPPRLLPRLRSVRPACKHQPAEYWAPRESCGGGFPSGLNPTNRPARTGAAVLQESYFCASVAHPQDIPVFRWTIPTPQHSKICICNKCVKRWLQRTHCSTSTFYINNCVTYPCLCVCRPSSLEPSWPGHRSSACTPRHSQRTPHWRRLLGDTAVMQWQLKCKSYKDSV